MLVGGILAHLDDRELHIHPETRFAVVDLTSPAASGAEQPYLV